MTPSGANKEWMMRLAANADNASAIIVSAAQCETMPRWATDKLRSAHTYIFAAMTCDFVIKAERELIGMHGVRMPDGTVKHTRQFLMDDILGKMFGKLSLKAPDEGVVTEFIVPIKEKLTVLLDSKDRHYESK